MKVSIQEFFRTGSIGTIGTGSTRHAVEYELGQPEAFAANEIGMHTAEIWRYSSLELHFLSGVTGEDGSDLLRSIFCDTFPMWPCDSELQIDRWIFSGPLQPTGRDLVANLEQLNIDFSEAPHHHEPGVLATRPRGEHLALERFTEAVARGAQCLHKYTTDLKTGGGVVCLIGFSQLIEAPEIVSEDLIFAFSRGCLI